MVFQCIDFGRRSAMISSPPGERGIESQAADCSQELKRKATILHSSSAVENFSCERTEIKYDGRGNNVRQIKSGDRVDLKRYCLTERQPSCCDSPRGLRCGHRAIQAGDLCQNAAMEVTISPGWTSRRLCVMRATDPRIPSL
jgi:hypothetical protein